MLRTIIASTLGLCLTAGAAHAASAWTGGDDQPTNPLACDAAAPTFTPKAYNGAQPTNPPDLKGKPITVVDVPKLVGIAYFAATAKGSPKAPRPSATWIPRPTGPRRPTSTIRSP